MCRWLAYTGSPILLTDVLDTPAHSPIDQSLHSKLGAETTNGDGFGLALSFGLEDDPPGAVARAIGFVEAAGRKRGITYPFQGTIATSDGEDLWMFRYSSEGTSRTPARAHRGRCSSAATSARCGSCIPAGRSCPSCPTTRG
jgi:hypothetical protein